MVSVLKKIDQGIDFLEKLIVGCGVLAATVIIFVNVVMRYGFLRSLMWAEELTRYIMIWVTFIGSSLCIKNNVHVKMDLLHVKLPFKIAKPLVCLVYLICIIGSLWLAQIGYQLTVQIAKLGQVSSAMSWLPMWVVNVCVPAFAVMAVKDYVILLVLNLRNKGVIIKETEGGPT